VASKLDRLLGAYRQHLTVPWQEGLAAIQRVIFAVYDKTDELRLRANIGEFELVTAQAGKRWLLIDLTDAFPAWMASQEYREAYFESPEDLAGYQAGEFTEFVVALKAQLESRIRAEAGSDTVVALLGVGTLFGIARVSAVVEHIKDAVPGRLLVFFPGEHHPDTHSYRLLDARDGWNYLAVPLTAQD
jgi:hypothetical protein